MSSLKKKTIKGIMWSALGKIFVNGSIFIFGILLARILTPHDFGIVGMVVFFIAVSKAIVEGGFSKALIQNQNNSQEDYSTVFYTNFFLSLIIFLILFVFAPVIADFYKTPVLTSIVRVSGLGIIVSSFAIVQRAQLSLQIDFRTQTIVTFISTIISGVFSIFLALKGAGVWSLVIKEIVQNFLITVLFWYIGKWRPSLIFSLKSFRYFTLTSLKLLGADLINVFYQNVIIMIIGKLFGSSSLGYYTRAKAFGDTSSLHASQIIQSVSFPVLSNIKNEMNVFKNAVSKFFRLSAFIAFPVTMALFVFSKEVVIVLLTSKWLPSVPLVQLICFAGFFHPLILMNQNIIAVLGHPKLYLNIEIFKLTLVILSIFATYTFGLQIMIAGQVLALLITYLVYAFYVKKIMSYGLWKQVGDIFSILALSFIMVGVMYLVKYLINNDLARLLSGLSIGGAVYLLGAYLFDFPEIREASLILERE